MFILTELIEKYRKEYEILFPYNSAFDLVPVNPFGLTGNDDLMALERQSYKKEWEDKKQKYIFQKVLDETNGEKFKELVAIMGNPGKLKPCDGSWKQCTYFCEDYPDCEYKKEFTQKEESKSESNIEVQPTAGGSNKNNRSGRKSSKRRKSKK